MNIRDPRTLACGLMLVLAAVLLPSAAIAVGTGNPVITSPTEASALYSGFTGPFVVRFDDAPKDFYEYSVIADPAGAATVVRGPFQYDGRDGASGDHQFPVAALSPGTYRFAISDVSTHTHQDSVDFTVRSGSAPKCSLVVPTTVRVRAPLTKVTGRLSSTCASLGTKSADWKVTRASRVYDYYRFTTNTSDTWSVYDADPMGGYAILPLSARATDNSAVPQNSPSVVVRRDSQLRLGGSRSGSTVTVKVSLTKYSTTANTFVPWTAKYVALSYRSCSTCAWHQLRGLTTDAQGRATYRFTASRTRDYRVAVSGTPDVWAARPAYRRL